jgi:hypothetical protein
MSEPRDLQPREDRRAKPPRVTPSALARGFGWPRLAWMVPGAATLAALVVFGFDSSEQLRIPAPAVAHRGSDLNPETTGSVNPFAFMPRADRVPLPSPRAPRLSPAPAQPDSGSREADLDAAPAPALPPAISGKPVLGQSDAGSASQSAAPTLTQPAERAPSTPLSLSPEVIAAHLTRGEQKLRAGELSTARLYFERVVRAGDARGALGMARTYDPAVLADLPLIGPQGDADMARKWYQRATSLQAGMTAGPSR